MEEIKLLKQDIVNLNIKISKLESVINGYDSFIKKNVEHILDKLEMKFIYPNTCQRCEGHGSIYISPISDCGQGNKCPKCNGEGKLWL